MSPVHRFTESELLTVLAADSAGSEPIGYRSLPVEPGKIKLVETMELTPSLSPGFWHVVRIMGSAADYTKKPVLASDEGLGSYFSYLGFHVERATWVSFLTQRRQYNAMDPDVPASLRRPEKPKPMDQAPSSTYSSTEYVYFFQSEDGGAIKIGTSNAPRTRLRAIQTMSPLPLRIVGLMVGSYALETELHRRFSHLRSHGEWFEPGRELVDFIRQQSLNPSPSVA